MRSSLSIIIIISLVFCQTLLFAQQKQVILTTTDLKEDYKILGIVTYSSGTPDIDLVNDGLRKKAQQMDADYVISIRYISHTGKIFGCGTAVKVKKDLR